jgi:hypothetical protein
MSTRTWINLILLVLIAILSSIMVYKPGQRPESALSLTQLEPAQINRITIHRLGKPEIRLELQNSGWRLTAPIEIAASRAAVGTLLRLALTPSLGRYPVKSLDLAEYGLAPALTTIELNDTAIDIGAPNPVDQRRYVRINDTVQLISDDLYDIYATEPAAYVTTKLLPEEAKIQRLTLPGMEIVQSSEHQWQTKAPAKDLTSAKLNKLVEAWQNTEAQWVQTYDGIKTPNNVTVSLTDGQNLRFIITATQPQLVLARLELQLQYHLPAKLVEQLFPDGVAQASSDGQRRSGSAQ